MFLCNFLPAELLSSRLPEAPVSRQSAPVVQSYLVSASDRVISTSKQIVPIVTTTFSHTQWILHHHPIPLPPLDVPSGNGCLVNDVE